MGILPRTGCPWGRSVFFARTPSNRPPCPWILRRSAQCVATMSKEATLGRMISIGRGPTSAVGRSLKTEQHVLSTSLSPASVGRHFRDALGDQVFFTNPVSFHCGGSGQLAVTKRNGGSDKPCWTSRNGRSAVGKGCLQKNLWGNPRFGTVNATTRFLHGEFDPGSGRTLAARLTHASRARKSLRRRVQRRTGE
jgi:hypothetical protein